MTNEDDVLNDDDIAELNRAVLTRTASICRVVGLVMIIVGALGAAGWLWFQVRAQMTVRGFSFGDSDGSERTFAQRIDMVLTQMGMLTTAALSLGAGVGLRLLSEHVLVANGGSLTGWESGDELPPEDNGPYEKLTEPTHT